MKKLSIVFAAASLLFAANAYAQAPKDMSTSDAGSVGNTQAPKSAPGRVTPAKDMSTSDSGSAGASRAPTSAPGPRTAGKDMSTSDTPK
jgi:hypothetical protein